MESYASRYSDFPVDPTAILGPISGYQNSKLTSLDEALQSVRHIIPQLGLMLYTVERKCQSRSRELDKNEVAAIILYTLEWTPSENSFYFILNRTLREGNRRLLIPWYPYLRIFIGALSKLWTNEPKTIYRYTDKDISGLYLDKKEIYTWWSFSSAETVQYSTNRELQGNQRQTIFKIHARSVIDISPYSFSGDKHEHLLLAGIELQFKSRTYFSDKECIVELQETQPKFNNLVFPLENPKIDSPFGIYSKSKDINILILGQSGVGKSTFINAISNYLLYERLDEALKNRFHFLIRSELKQTDGDQHEKVYFCGEQDDNENTEIGESATQSCRSYIFPLGNRSLRLIDVPGIGDTRGIERDKINVTQILNHVSQYPYLNGICILLKATETRTNVQFTFCLKELFRFLHRSAQHNIFFICTESRTKDYKIVESFKMTQNILKDINSKNEAEIPVSKDRLFAFDNECVQFFLKKYNNLEVPDELMKYYGKSWQFSVKSFDSLIQAILKVDPHRVRDTVSLNEASQQSQIISGLLKTTDKIIEENKQLAEEHRQKILNKTVVQRNILEQKVFRCVPLGKGQTVCTSDTCRQTSQKHTESLNNLYKPCENPTTIEGVHANHVGHPLLKHCHIMDRNGFCKKCGCSWLNHKIMSHSIVSSKANVLIVPEKLDRTEDEGIISQIEEQIKSLQKEKEFLRKASAKLDIFVAENVISQKNDATIEYLQMLLRNEMAERTKNTEKINGIRASISRLTEGTTSDGVLESALTNETEKLKSVEEIFNLMEEITRLPKNGEMIRKQMEEIRFNCVKSVVKYEKIVSFLGKRGENVRTEFLKLLES